MSSFPSHHPTFTVIPSYIRIEYIDDGFRNIGDVVDFSSIMEKNHFKTTVGCCVILCEGIFRGVISNSNKILHFTNVSRENNETMVKTTEKNGVDFFLHFMWKGENEEGKKKEYRISPKRLIRSNLFKHEFGISPAATVQTNSFFPSQQNFQNDHILKQTLYGNFGDFIEFDFNEEEKQNEVFGNTEFLKKVEHYCYNNNKEEGDCIKVGEEVFIISSPFAGLSQSSLEFSFSKGIISNEMVEKDIFLTDAPCFPGSQGNK